jgi:hypothetical protein
MKFRFKCGRVSSLSTGTALADLRRGGLPLIVMFFCALLSSASTFAQVQTADVVGTVTDTSGAVIPGATVTITNTATNVSQSTATNSTGDYIFNLLQVGAYAIKIEAKGFKAYTIPNIALSATDRAREDAKMEVGNVTETVEVSGNVAPALQTDSANLGTLVTSQAVQDVPLNGRNFVKLVQLSAGVSIGGAGDTSSGTRPDDRRLTSEYTVNAQNTDANNNLIDGMDNNERFIGTLGVRPSVDAIQEVVVQTNLYDASVGRTGGGVTNVVTKSGTNNFHGTGYEFFRNRVLNTNPNYQFPASYTSTGSLNLTTALAKPAFRQNQYGGSIGGPIKKDKMFFFGDFEQFSTALGIPSTGTVPTLCQRGTALIAAQKAAGQKTYSGGSAACPDNPAGSLTPGDMSEIVNVGTGAAGGSSSIGSTPGNNVPVGSITPVGEAVFSLFPLPNSAGVSSNYSADPMRTQGAKTFDVRIDGHVSDKDNFFGRYSYNNVTTFTPSVFPSVDLAKVDPAFSGTDVVLNPGGSAGSGNQFFGPSKQRQQGVTLSWVHIYQPTLLLELKAGYLRSSTQSLPPNQGKNATNALGVACNTVNCVNFIPSVFSGLADFNFSSPNGGYPQLATNLGDSGFIPLQTFDNSYIYSATLTWNKGNHSIRYGLGLIRRQLTEYQSSNGIGSFSFTGVYTGTPLGDLLEGLSQTAARNTYLVSPGYRSWEPNGYVQDDWRATRWLTLNLGVRYDIFTPFTEKRGRISNYNMATGVVNGPSIPGAQDSGPTALLPTPYGDIAPRFGFAMTLPHDMVVRGGFGTSYYPQGYGTPQALRNQPFNVTFSCTNQVASQASITCPNSIASTATANYGSTGSGSPVGQSGGDLLAQGLPIPTLNIANVFAPPSSICTFTTNAAYSPTPISGTCPSSTNPYNSGVSDAFWPGYKDGMLEQFNLTVQKAFGANVVSLGYVGEMGRDQIVNYSPNHDSNYTQVCTNVNAAPCTGLPLGQNPLASQFPWLAKSTVSEQNLPWGTTSYQSLQAIFVRRFSRGLTVQANYTWAHSLENYGAVCTPTFSPSVLGYGNGPRYTNPCFYDNVKSTSTPIVVTAGEGGVFGVGNTGLDVPNRYSGTVNYQLPFGKNMKGVGAQVVKGWTLNDAFSWQSGIPYSITTSVQPAGGVALLGSGRPDQICSGRTGSKSLQNYGINPACFQLATANTYGNEHPNQFFGPPNRAMDFSAVKEFPLKGEALRLQFRAEVFNLFNTPNFSSPGVTAIPSFGAANGNSFSNTAGSTGNVESTPTSTALHPGAITSLNTNYNSRQIQFALKLIF